MKQLLCFGDSNTWGLIPKTTDRYSWGVRWTSVLQKKLKNRDVRVIEEGLCGRTTVYDDAYRKNRNGLESLPEILESSYPVDVEPVHQMEKVLYATDELTGLIGAAVKMRPSQSTSDFEVKSLKKKFKDKKFAAGCSRDVIKFGAELLGWDLDKLFEQTILAMRSCENDVKSELENLGYEL